MQILLTTNERISQWFNVSLLALTVGAMLMCYFHLPIAAYLALLAVIGFFIYDGATFRTKLDHSFAAIGDPDQEGLDLAASATGAKAAPPPTLSAQTSTRAASADGGADAITKARLQGYRDLRGQEEAPSSLMGWLYKSPSRNGPGVRGGSPAVALKETSKAKRYFVLANGVLKWYNTEDEATLQRSALTAIDMRMYTCHEMDPVNRTLAICPVSPHVKKSWYLRALDEASYDSWCRALVAAGASAERAPGYDARGTYGGDPRGTCSGDVRATTQMW